MKWCLVGLVALLVLATLNGTAMARSQAVDDGAAALRAGNYQQAVKTLSAALETNLSSREAANALLYRGLADRKLGHATEALADLGAAIWLGLSTTDRIIALVQRSYVFQSLGLQALAQHQIALAKMAAPHETAEIMKDGDVVASIGTGNTPSLRYGSWWNRLISGREKRETASAAPAKSPATGAKTPTASEVSGWSITVDQADVAVAAESARKAARQRASSHAPAAPATGTWSSTTKAAPPAPHAEQAETTGWSTETHQSQ